MLTHVFLGLGIVCITAGLYLRNRVRRKDTVRPTRDDYRWTFGRRLLRRDSDLLWDSVESLRAERPDFAFDRTFSHAQIEALLLFGGAVAFFLSVDWNITMVMVVGAIILFYFGALAVRVVLFFKSYNGRGLLRVSDEVARSIPEHLLPRYSVLVPAYGEPEVVDKLVANLRAIDYPRERLEIMLLLESDDTPTIEAASVAVAEGSDIQIVLVPDGGPRTKPKALNYGLGTCTGEIVTIFDAEDRPDPLQLRKAAAALATAPPDVVCLQAKLGFFNPTQNTITRWFTLDYRMWFEQLLPGLVQINAAIPLGGTSNHFRREALIEIGAWDPFNVTEDADLGIRLHRLGYRTAALDSVTLEEANSDVINWIKQRSRWYKGYTQTALVHLRNPLRLYHELGLKSFVIFILFVGGTPMLAAFNPVFWILCLTWWVFHPTVIETVIPTLTYFLGQLCWLFGNAFVLYCWILTTRNPREKLWLAAILAPFYWVLMSVAAVKAMLQLVTDPSYWEKTQHGLDEEPEVEFQPSAA